MNTEHLKSLKRLRKKLTEAMNSNMKLTELPGIKDTDGAIMHLLVATVFGSSRNFVDQEIKLCKGVKK